MKPVRLRIRGLNSFIEEQEIDFERLTSAGIFGIFGKTGSGKTTIIDAITLALYGQMARFDGKAERQFVNMNAPEAWVELKFQMSSQGITSTYVAERIYRNPNAVKAKKSEKDSYGRLYRIDGDKQTIIADKENEVTKHVIELTGLEYSDFVRSVILPQGKFNEFLLLENKDRRLMLQRIFGFERYGKQLTNRVSERRRMMTAKLEEAENSASRYGALSADTLAEVRQYLTDQEQTLALMKERASEIASELDRLNKVRDLGNEYASYARELESLKLDEPQIKNIENMLDIARRADEVMQAAKAVGDSEQRIAALTQQLANAEKKEETTEREYRILKEKLDKHLEEKEKKFPELIRFEERLSNAKKLDEEINAYRKEREELLKAHAVENDKLKRSEITGEKLRAKLKLLEEDITKAQINLEGMEISPEHREKISKADEMYRKLNDLAAKNTAVEQKLKSAKDSKDVLVRKLSDLKNEQTNAQSKAAKLAEECVFLSNKLNMSAKAKVDNAVKLLVMELKDGEPCPICGSTEHPHTAREAVFDDELRELLSESNIIWWEKQLSDREAEKAEIAEQISGFSANLAAVTENIKNIEISLTDIESEIKNNGEQRNVLIDELGIGDKNIAEETEKIKAELIRIRRNDEARPDQQKKLAVLISEQNGAKAELDKTSMEAVEIRSKIQMIYQTGTDRKNLIAKKTEEIHEITGGAESVDKRLELLNAERADLLNACENASRETEQAEKQMKSAAESRKDLQSQKKTLDELLEEEKLRLKEELSLKGFAGVQEAAAGAMQQDRQKEHEVKIKNYRDRVERITINIERLSQQPGFELIKDPGQAEEINRKTVRLAAEKDATAQNIEDCTKDIGKIKSDIEAVEKQLSELAEVRERIKGLQAETDLLSDLASLLRGDEFVEYISKKQLAFLTDTATRKLLKMTSGKYALELDDTDFAMRDNSNGGLRRSPKTLSGGESFTASLCLALALSMKIQMSKNASMEFFFLDEGFGTLDKDTLDTVFDTLEQLGTEKIKVGIISHVEDLKSRLPSILSVTPASNGSGSKITIE